jgi:hypothetical protein
LEHLNFDIVSDFGFSASDLEFFGQAQVRKTKDELALACPG